MTSNEFSLHISSLCQELVKAAAEFTRTQCAPVGEAEARFSDAVSLFDADLSRKNERLSSKKASAQLSLEQLIQETEIAKNVLNLAIQDEDDAAEASATARLDELASQQFVAVNRQSALNRAEVRGSEELCHKVFSQLRELRAAHASADSSEYSFCINTLEATANKLLELCKGEPHAGIAHSIFLRNAEQTAFRVFEATTGPVDLGDIHNCGDDADKRHRFIRSLFEGRVMPGLENTAAGKRLNAIFAEQPSPRDV